MIKIQKSKTADTRTADSEVTKDQLLESSMQHKRDVYEGMRFFAHAIELAGNIHDHTKVSEIDSFYENFHKAQNDPSFNFRDCDWFKLHVTTERHHLKDHVPDDVNLLDVLERIADICMAAAGRSGKDENGKIQFYSDALSGELLQRAYDNTVKLLLDEIEVEE